MMERSSLSLLQTEDRIIVEKAEQRFKEIEGDRVHPLSAEKFWEVVERNRKKK